MTDLMPVILLFSIIIVTFNRGFFSIPSLGTVIILYFLLVKQAIKTGTLPTGKNHPEGSKTQYFFVFISTYTLLLFNWGGIYHTRLIPTMLLNFLPILAFP